MIARNELELAQAYLAAKRHILESAYRTELVHVHHDPIGVSESDFLRELAWAILSGGMAEVVIRKKFPDISRCFLDWESARQIVEQTDECISGALRYFRHEGKIKAIATAANMLCVTGSFEGFKADILQNPIGTLRSFPYIGPITAYHVAKNIGIRVAKPDRHLARLARTNGFKSVAEFCGTIAGFLGEDIRLVDSVLWRFATMHRDYAARFQQLSCAKVYQQHCATLPH